MPTSFSLLVESIARIGESVSPQQVVSDKRTL